MRSHETRVLAPEEMPKVYAALDKAEPKMADAFKLSLLTAQRQAEVLGMKWERDCGRLVDRASQQRSKNERPNRVWLSNAARVVLERRRKDCRGSAFVFPARFNATDKSLRPASKLSWSSSAHSSVTRNFVWHDIRRTVSTELSKMKVAPHVREAVLNHALKGVGEVHYNQYGYDDEKREALDAWAIRLDHVAKFGTEPRTNRRLAAVA